jgi:hypothetical protein
MSRPRRCPSLSLGASARWSIGNFLSDQSDLQSQSPLPSPHLPPYGHTVAQPAAKPKLLTGNADTKIVESSATTIEISDNVHIIIHSCLPGSQSVKFFPSSVILLASSAEFPPSSLGGATSDPRVLPLRPFSGFSSPRDL